jgi:hypothetical protein
MQATKLSNTTIRGTAILALAATLAGCLSHPEPIIDTKGVDMVAYQHDLAECEAYAEQVRIGEGVAKGAAGGAVVGGATGAILGDAGKGAGVGAVGGAARSAQIGEREKTQVVKNCLRGRGYRVLN